MNIKIYHSKIAENISSDMLNKISAEDIKRYNSINSRVRAAAFVTGRVLLANSLSSNKIADYKTLPMKYLASGKPMFVDECLINFNITHSADDLFLIISDSICGIDCEQIRAINYKKIAKKFFTQQELDFLDGLSETANINIEFFKIWTRKEAEVKMHGTSIFSIRKKQSREDIKTYRFNNSILSFCQESSASDVDFVGFNTKSCF